MPEDTEQSAPRSLIETIRGFFSDARQFFHDELWDMDLRTLPRMKQFVVSLIRICGIVLKGFADDKCTLQASALTYFTLMSLVPVLALMFFVAKGAGAQGKLMEFVGLESMVDTGEYVVVAGSKLAELPEQAAAIAKVLFAAVDNANFGAIGIVGIVFLLWAAVKVMTKIEDAFNTIWGIYESRKLMQKFAYYLAVLFMVPILVLVATSTNALLSSERVTAQLQENLGPLFYAYQKGLGLTGLFVIFMAFIVLYMFMPNTRVRVFPALVGGVIGGGIWYLLQIFYFAAQVGLAQKNAIYGTFSAFPLFLVWLYMSWVVVLFGAEISFAIQNYRTYIQERHARGASFATRQTLGMLVVHQISKSHFEGLGPWDQQEFCVQYGIPTRLVLSIAEDLRQAGIIAPVQAKGGVRYLPCNDIARLTLRDVEHALIGDVSKAVSQAATHQSAALQNVYAEHFKDFSEALGDTTFREVVAGNGQRNERG